MVISSLRLSPRKELAARLLSTGLKQIQVARDDRIKVTKQTMHIWCQDPVFKARIDEYRTDKLKQADEMLNDRVLDAVETIVDIATSKPVDDEGNPIDSRIISTKFAAAKWVAERAMGKKMPPINKTKQEEEEYNLEDDEMDEIIASAKK